VEDMKYKKYAIEEKIRMYSTNFVLNCKKKRDRDESCNVWVNQLLPPFQIISRLTFLDS